MQVSQNLRFSLITKFIPSPHLFGGSVGPSDFTQSESQSSAFMVYLSKHSRPPVLEKRWICEKSEIGLV